MRKITFLAILFPFLIQAQTFEEMETELENYYYSAADVADFNGDGYIDIMMTGAIDSDLDGGVDYTFNELYKNADGTTFLPHQGYDGSSVHLSDIKFIDFDNDGLLDFVSAGLSYNDVVNYQQYRFKNNGNGFDVMDNIPGKIYGSLETFDFNHDGRMDYALNGVQYVENTGFTYEIDFYENTGVDFEMTTNWLPGSQNSSFKVADFNNDNLLDVICNGYNSESEPFFHVYLNNDGVLTLSQELGAVSDGGLGFADFNADGHLDFVASGLDVDYNEFTAFYLNDGSGNFTVIPIEGVGIGSSSISVGDLNNDGYYDFAVIGDDVDYNGWVKIFLFDSVNSTFIEAENTGIYNLGSQGDIELFDLDNDNHLDMLISGFDWADDDMPSLTKLFKNTSTEENLKPNAPTELNLEQDGNRLNFSWIGATDDKTPTEALQYELKVGTTSGSQDIAKYIVTTPNWFLELEEVPSNLFWSVKSIDASEIYSNKSEEAQLSIFDNIATQEVKFYPNPAKDIVYFDSDKEIQSVELYSISGQKIPTSFANKQVNISHLPSGVYILKLQVEGKMITEKLVVK